MKRHVPTLRGNTPQCGVALIAVLWIVAALGILVTGMVQSQRDEIRIVATARDALQASAIGGGATQLVLQKISLRPEAADRLSRMEVEYAGLNIAVEVMPLNGLVDINKASEQLLAALFAVAGGLPVDAAAGLARNLAASRLPGQGRTTGPRYEAVEDLLQLPGVDFDLYARLSSIVTTDAAGSGRVNPLAAPPGVLAVLANGNSARSASVAAARDAGKPGVDTTNLSAEFVDNSVSTRFRLQARVPLADGRWLLSTRTVNAAKDATRGLPWRILHSEDRVEPFPATN
ncbi:MAG: type II secretion system protein GspK [Ramlibacter sp.]